MSDKKFSKESIQRLHTEIPRPPYDGYFALFWLEHLPFIEDHDLYARVLHAPWEKLTAAIDSFFKHPQLRTLPSRKLSVDTALVPPQLHTQFHITRFPLFGSLCVTNNRPNVMFS